MYYTVAMYVDVAGEDAENPSGNCMLSTMVVQCEGKLSLVLGVFMAPL